MEKADESTAVTSKVANQLLSRDIRDLEIVSSYATEKEAEVQKLSVQCTDMGYLRLVWDSKVPEKDKTLFHFINLASSSLEDVLEAIKKYQNFYKELGVAVHKVGNEKEQTDIEKINPYLIILELDETLSEMAVSAEIGENATASSTIYNLHKSFIEKHEKLENMIKRVECVALKEGLKKATDGWRQSIQSINNLVDDLKSTNDKYDQMCDRFGTLLLQNEVLMEQQKILLNNNGKMELQLENLLKENISIKTILKENGQM